MIEKLFEKYDVQDVGQYAQIYLNGKHIRIATLSNENNVWLITPEGKALLAEEPAIEEDKPKRTRARTSTTEE